MPAPQVSNSYDELPYLDHFVPETSPDRMAAMATLHGMSPPDPRRCRVLEIGCASGANLFPMAAAMPEARFIGIDLSARQIEQGRAILGILGLENVTLRAMSLLDVGDDFGQFDYIVCHGVFSWVPAAARDKILAIFARHLSPDGVAYLSYNTYPGWHFRGMIRDMLKYHSDTFDDATARVGQARAFLEFLALSVPKAESTYARVLNDERAIVETSQDTYVFHEHLEDVNQPIYFHELIAQATDHGLGYLGPARFDTIDHNLPEPVRQALDEFGTDRIRREQYLDFVRNRAFRKSLLCHADRPRTDLPDPAAMDRLRFSAMAKPEAERPDVRSDAPIEFRSPTDDRLTTTRPLVKAALIALFTAWPRSLSLEQLWAEVETLLGSSLDGDRRMLAEILLKAHVGNLAAFHAYEPPLVTVPGDRPVASIVARYQAEAEAKICNLRHRMVNLDDFATLVIRLLDGTRDRDEILATLARWADEGVFEVAQGNRAVLDDSQLRAALAECLDASLKQLAKYALLVG